MLEEYLSASGKCLIDTNVPKTANLVWHDSSSNIPDACIEECINAVEHISKNGGLVLDEDGEIFNEYLKNLSLCGQPGPGDAFLKWVYNHQWNPQKVDRIQITKNGASYDEFPCHSALDNFDKSDRKFIAVANAHPDKPPILQATDSKWWGWNDALAKVDIKVGFLCPDYAKKQCAKKTTK